MTEIGEKGVNLSGGQQQRVSLARAAYTTSDIVLLDDPLSAVDSHVGEHIFNHLILRFLKGRTRILVTHNLALCAARADQVVCVGTVEGSTANSIILSCPPREIAGAIKRLQEEGVAGSGRGLFLEGLEGSVSSWASGEAQDDDENQSQNSSFIEEIPLEESKEGKIGIGPKNYSYVSLGKVSLTRGRTEGQNDEDDRRKSKQTSAVSASGKDTGIVVLEKKGEGEISLSVYWYYLKAAGGLSSLLGLLFAGIWVSLSWLSQSYSLGKWMEDMESSHSPNGSSFHRYLFCLFSVLSACTFRSLFQISSSLKAARRMHENLLQSTLLATCSWFDSTPVGRIINRFSQDITTIDQNTMVYLVDFLDCLLGSLQIVGVISMSFPLLLLALLPIVLFTTWVSYQYLRVSRELKRLESVKKSPVFVLFSETLLGLPIIRAFRREEFFFDLCCKKVDEMNRCHLYMWICNRWLNFRMQILGSLLAGTVGTAVIMQAKTIGSTAAGEHCISFLN